MTPSRRRPVVSYLHNTYRVSEGRGRRCVTSGLTFSDGYTPSISLGMLLTRPD